MTPDEVREQGALLINLVDMDIMVAILDPPEPATCHVYEVDGKLVIIYNNEGQELVFKEEA